jgi:prevent-host-death family protein
MNMTNLVTILMRQINVHEAKAKLTEYLDAALRGERIVIARRNVPLVELKAIAQTSSVPRSIGAGPREDGYELPDSFWEPLPDDLAAAFAGGSVEPTGEAGSAATEPAPAAR